ncbi:MAG: FG-GAP repeat domain-containing protein [Verrucomicrobiales bacterium]
MRLNQRNSPIILTALGLAGIAGVAIFALMKLRKPGEGSDAVIGSIKTRRSGEYQRPVPQMGSVSTAIDFSSTAPKSAADEQLENLDPDQAGWETESLSDATGRAMDQIFSSDATARPFAQDFRATPFEPALTEVFADNGIRVRRWGGDPPPDEAHTLDESAFLTSRPKAAGSRKIVRITRETDRFFTRVIASTHHEPATGPWQQTTSEWDCEWELPGKESPDLPRLRRLTVRSHEEITRTAKAPWFEDTAASVLPDKHGPHDFPITHWAQRLTKIDDMHFTGHHGIALGDADGDGHDDLYVCDGGGLPNRLYLQNPDATTRDVSAEAGVDWLEASRAALFVDLDNDGDQDLVVATVALILVMENDGQARFSLHGGIPGMSDPHSLSAADFDGDGTLDLFVCNYGARATAGGERGFEARAPVPFNDAKNGGRNALFRNNGALRFSDVTVETGLTAGGDRWSFAAAWEDFDNDGDQDLYIANDFGRNNLFRNDGGKFTDIASAAGVEDISSGMSVDWGDANRDGRMDIYVGNMFSSAGGRIAYQRQFGKNNPEAAPDFQRMARGNTLFHGDSDGTFRDASESSGVTVGLWAWSSLFADINNDGWQDFVVTNGYMTNPRGGGPDL